MMQHHRKNVLVLNNRAFSVQTLHVPRVQGVFTLLLLPQSKDVHEHSASSVSALCGNKQPVPMDGCLEVRFYVALN